MTTQVAEPLPAESAGVRSTAVPAVRSSGVSPGDCPSAPVPPSPLEGISSTSTPSGGRDARTTNGRDARATLPVRPIKKCAHVSPNDRCPCGSGKKVKKCCGVEKAEAMLTAETPRRGEQPDKCHGQPLPLATRAVAPDGVDADTPPASWSAGLQAAHAAGFQAGSNNNHAGPEASGPAGVDAGAPASSPQPPDTRSTKVSSSVTTPSCGRDAGATDGTPLWHTVTGFAGGRPASLAERAKGLAQLAAWVEHEFTLILAAQKAGQRPSDPCWEPSHELAFRLGLPEAHLNRLCREHDGLSARERWDRLRAPEFLQSLEEEIRDMLSGHPLFEDPGMALISPRMTLEMLNKRLRSMRRMKGWTKTALAWRLGFRGHQRVNLAVFRLTGKTVAEVEACLIAESANELLDRAQQCISRSEENAPASQASPESHTSYKTKNDDTASTPGVNLHEKRQRKGDKAAAA